MNDTRYDMNDFSSLFIYGDDGREPIGLRDEFLRDIVTNKDPDFNDRLFGAQVRMPLPMQLAIAPALLARFLNLEENQQEAFISNLRDNIVMVYADLYLEEKYGPHSYADVQAARSSFAAQYATQLTHALSSLPKDSSRHHAVTTGCRLAVEIFNDTPVSTLPSCFRLPQRQDIFHPTDDDLIVWRDRLDQFASERGSGMPSPTEPRQPTNEQGMPKLKNDLI